RATIAGLEAKDAAVKLRLDAGGLVLERLAGNDLGGATFGVTRRIESPFSRPPGAVPLDADPRSPGRRRARLPRVAPDVAEKARSIAPRLVPLKTHTTLILAAERGANGPSKLVMDGTAGAVRLQLAAQANGDTSAPAALDTRIEGELAAEDGRSLVK